MLVPSTASGKEGYLFFLWNPLYAKGEERVDKRLSDVGVS